MANSHAYNRCYRDLDLINSTAEDEALRRMNRVRSIRNHRENREADDALRDTAYWGA